MKPRIHIIGGPGSGKTYLAGRLAKHFGVTAHELDGLFWDGKASGYGVRADAGARDRQLRELVAQDGWIIEGVYYQWLTPSFDAADLIVALTPAIWVRHWRVVKRFGLRKCGRVPTKRESFGDLWRLLRWSHAYDAINLTEARKLNVGRGKRVIESGTFEEVVAAVETGRNERGPETKAVSSRNEGWGAGD